ncbi:phosphatase PAP2 family protein [Fictibacillus iocasae]|uniref:Phosphatase PAP2 family protein n=1 Tax=Fictibacillus iocasae TaxID=2715437 RepID=A0ABW2NSX3_9BACL
MRKMPSIRSMLGACALVFLFALLALYYESVFLRKYDLLLMNAVSQLQSPMLDQVFILISDSASRPAEFFLLTLFAIWCATVKKRAAEPLLLTAALVGVRYMNSWLKDVFERDRPAFQPIIDAPGYSFPSGHAMISLAFFFLLIIVLTNIICLTEWKAKTALVLTGIFVFLVGLSRVYLGVHYPSDVIAGFIAGTVWLMLSLSVYRRLPKPND